MKFVIAFIFLLLPIQSTSAQYYQQPVVQPIAVGIPSNRFNFVVSEQQKPQWCWAASIEMVLKYYGVSISQEQIVRRTFGGLPNWAGSFRVITANLNNWSRDNNGRVYTVRASISQGAPTAAFLLQELSRQRPVIVGYSTGQNTGHAVVITGATYLPSPRGPMIQSIIVRDPWPSRQNRRKRGRIVYPGFDFARKMQASWFISVR